MLSKSTCAKGCQTAVEEGWNEIWINLQSPPIALIRCLVISTFVRCTEMQDSQRQPSSKAACKLSIEVSTASTYQHHPPP